MLQEDMVAATGEEETLEVNGGRGRGRQNVFGKREGGERK
jgi:hypothetical protein